MPNPEKITKDMTIHEVLNRYPKAIEVMQDFGLFCAGCHLGAFETVEQGILGHGMDQKTLKELLTALNKGLKDFHGIHVTERAALKILALAESENKNPYLRVKAEQKKDEWIYSMDFAARPKKTEKKLEFQAGVALLIDSRSFKNLKGSTIDYVMNYETEGFKINNPNEKSTLDNSSN